MSNRTINSTRNILTGLINNFINIFFPFVIRTILIKKIGIDYLGLNNLITSILQVLNLTELGFSTAIIFSMYKPLAEKNHKKICELMTFYRQAYRIIGLVILLSGLLLMPLLPSFIKNDIPSGVDIRLVYLVYLLNISINYFMFYYKNSLLIAHQRQDIVSNISSVTLMIQFALQIIVLIIFRNYYLYILVFPVMSLLNNFLSYYHANKLYPQYKKGGKLDSITIKEIKKRVTGLMLFKISSATRNSFHSIYISTYIGLLSVATYNNYYYIINSLGGLLNVITIAMNASIGNSIVTESTSKNFNDFRILNFIYMLISGWFMISLVCLFQPFMIFWVGKDLLLPMNIVLMMCIYFYTLRMGDIRGIYNDAAGLWWEQRYRTLVEMLVNIFLNWILIKSYGIIGGVLGTISTILIFGFGLSGYITFKYYFGIERFKGFLKTHLIYMTVTIFIAIISYQICKHIYFDNKLVEILLKEFLCTILTISLYILIYHKTQTYREACVFIKDKLKNYSFMKQ